MAVLGDEDVLRLQISVHDAGRVRSGKRTPIPTNDMWVAALVLQHNLALLARDRHFDALPQITRI